MKLGNVVITGASGGLAEQIISQIDAENLILISRNIDRLLDKYTARKDIHLFECDITKDKDLGLVCHNISKQFGTIDLLINNAGYGEFKNFMAFSYDEVVKMFEVNTLSLMNITRRFLPDMKKQRSGQIINIASMAGKMSTINSSIYAASKAAVISFSDALRLELKEDNIIVTTVNPGPIKTSFFDRADPSGEYQKKVSFVLLDPEKVAGKIVKNIGKNKREINMPFIMNIASKFYQLFPKIGDFLTAGPFNLK